MGWYSDTWTRRVAVTLNENGSSPNDFDVPIPAAFDDFWDSIDSAGNELRVVDADGETLLSYDVDDGAGGAFDAANRAGRIRIDGLTTTAITGNSAVWLYYAPTSVQGDASSSVTIASSLAGEILLSRPSGWTFGHSPVSAGTQLRRTITKASAERVAVWIDYSAFFARRFTAGWGSSLYEDPYAVEIDVLNSSGVSQGGMFDATTNRIVWHGKRALVRVFVKSGVDGNDYTLVVRAYSIAHGGAEPLQTLEDRIKVQVRDTLAA